MLDPKGFGVAQCTSIADEFANATDFDAICKSIELLDDTFLSTEPPITGMQFTTIHITFVDGIATQCAARTPIELL